MPTIYVNLEGVGEGGKLSGHVLQRGQSTEFEIDVGEWDVPRVVADRLASRLDSLQPNLGERLENAGGVVLLREVDDFQVESADVGIFATDVETVPTTRLTGETFGSRFAASGYADHDREVLDHLGLWVGELARSAKAEQMLIRNSSAALNANTANPLSTGLSPMSGGGGGDGATMASAIAATMSATAKLAKARGEQLKAIEQKEREAKGNGGGAGQPGGLPPTVGPGPWLPPDPDPTGGGGGGGSPAPGPSSGTGTGGSDGTAGKEPENGTVARPLGTDNELRPIETPCEIITYIIDGVEYTIGKFDDGWFLALDKGGLEVFQNDGSFTIVPDSYNFGDIYADDPDMRPLEVDKAHLDAMVQQRQQAASEEDDPWKDAASVASFVLDLVPIVGQIKGGVELATGYDYVTGRQLSTEERAVAAVFMLLPFAGGAIKAGTKAGLRAAQKAIRAGRSLTGSHLGTLEDALRQLRRSRMRRRTSRAEVQVRRCGDPNSRVGRRGSRRNLTRCFASGTKVRQVSGDHIPIEIIRPAMSIASVPGAAMQPNSNAPSNRRVLRRYARSAEETMTFTLRGEEGGQDWPLTTTSAHLFATPSGYRAAGWLQPGNHVLRAEGRLAVVVDVVAKPDKEPVYNLEVSVDHNYLVTPLDILVHNSCPCSEFWSQVQTEKMLEDEGFEFFHGVDDAGDFLFGSSKHKNFKPEPEFKDGLFTGRKGRKKNGTQMAYPKKYSTRPDVLGRENGQLVAYEIKTIADDWSTYSHLKRYRDPIANQVGGRFMGMTSRNGVPLPADHRLIIDVRNSFETEEGVIKALRRLADEDNFRDLAEYSGGVRVIVGTRDAPDIGRLISWDEILS
ncbi:pre-toxin TG domain-containing protein [Litoreibacter janthinus]|uniref:Intein C-terminal splicing region n=1 Tax=Litoreibacter janthinus TaxID=670154 RepID=A0A1I6GA06_9RHOB|nr:pre-toxin TG domain-containing protein [Litoreibacter janthinus]SFR39046.1 intein C-terminal splicing region [Litoreibacter janthinus]